MRGDDRRWGNLFSYVDLEARVATDQPLRPIRTSVDDALLAAMVYLRLSRPRPNRD